MLETSVKSEVQAPPPVEGEHPKEKRDGQSNSKRLVTAQSSDLPRAVFAVLPEKNAEFHSAGREEWTRAGRARKHG